MTNDQLAQVLESTGLFKGDALNKLKRESLLANRSIEELIYERNLASDIKIAEAKSKVLSVPYQKIDFNNFDPAILETVPEDTARTYGVAPLSKNGDLLVVGMLQPDDVHAQEALKFIANRNRVSLGVYLMSYGDWQEVLRKYSPYKASIENAVKNLNLKTGGLASARRIVRLEEGSGSGEDAPIIKIVTDTFREAVQSRASDIHIEPQENYLRVRFRLDGELREMASLPLELAAPVVSRVKVISNLKIDENRIPQDGRFRTRIFDRDIDFRIATFPTPLGEKVAIRVLDPTTGLKSFDQLGLSPHNLKIVQEGLGKPYGMILLTGPTGSGKTTTLYAFLQTLNKEDVNIVSLEDPVEYSMSGVNQSQVRPEIGYDFASGLRQILRQDPDVIMVGEIRDNETAALAVQAALTGHIVLSTLHTNNAAGVVPRLLDMKVDPFLLPVSLNLMLAQRLVGQLCPDCKAPAPAPENVAREIDNALSNLPADVDASKYKKPYQIYHAPGCGKCKERGVVGRIAIYEVFRMTSGLAEIINSGPTYAKLEKEAKTQGMMSIRADGVLKALEGLVSMEEVLRATAEA